MIWLLFSFLTALFRSLEDVFSKHNLKTIDEYVISWSLRSFSLLFLIPVLFFIDMPSLGNKFWLALLISGSLNAITTVLYIKAIKHSDLSVTAPMITFTPLFLLITSPLILKEFPSILGLIGVLLIVLGAYTLNIQKRHAEYLEPFKALLKEKGPRLMLLVAFMWSITSNFDKMGVQNSSAIFWVMSINLFITLAIFPIMLYRSRDSLKQIKTRYKMLMPIGLFSALGLIFQMIAINLTLVAYVISVKRISTIISVLFGHFIFKEEGIKERLLGVVIMVLGVLLITLS